MLSCARRTQALPARVVAACLVLLTSLALLFAASPAAAQPTYAPLLQLARGHLLVSVGTPPQWLPESGVATSLTLFSGAPAHPGDSADNAYIALQNAGGRCASTPAGDGAPLLELPNYYAGTDLISAHASSPWRGAQAGDYAASLSSVVIHQTGRVLACVWLAGKPQDRGLALSEKIRLLNGLFAASMSVLTSASTGIGGGYTLDAIDVGQTFSYTVATLQCGVRAVDAGGSVPDGQLATESIAFETNPCAGDGSTVAFSRAGHGPFARLAYTEAQAVAAPPATATVGGCELDPVAVIPVAEAIPYVETVGCRVGRLVVAPYNPTLPRGAVIEAQVDGGLAEVAPRGMSVDLELNGRPVTSATRHR